MKRILLCLAPLFLLACQGTVVRDEDSPHYIVPAGSALVLQERLEIPPRAASIHIQNGKAMPYKLVNRYYPHCKFEMWSITEEARFVEPDRFIVERVKRDWEFIGQGFGKPVRIAANGELRWAGVEFGGSEGGPAFEIDATELFLRSEKQPDVYRLTCSQWSDVRAARHVTVSEIRQTLGPLFLLEIPAEPSP